MYSIFPNKLNIITMLKTGESKNFMKVGTTITIFDCRVGQLRMAKNRECPIVIGTVGNYAQVINSNTIILCV